MRVFLLIAMYSVLMASEMFGWKLGFGTGLSIKNGFLYVLLLGIALELLIHRRPGDALTIPVNGFFLALIAYALASWLITDREYQFAGYTHGERFISLKGLLIDHYLFFAVYFYGTRTQKEAVRVTIFVLILFVIGNLITLMDAYDMPDLGLIKWIAGRISGPLGEPNQYAAFSVMFLPTLVALTIRNGVSLRVLFGLGALATIAVILLTGSRGGAVGMIGGLAVGSIVMRRYISPGRIVKVIVLVAPLAIVALGVVASKFSGLLEERVEQSSAGNLRDASAGRTMIWETGLRVQAEDPALFLWGRGWDTFRPEVRQASHNTYLEYLFNLGVIGLGLYLGLIASITRLQLYGLTGATGDERLLIIGFVLGWLCMLIAVFFVNLFNPWVFVWAYTGLVSRIAVHCAPARQRTTALSVRANSRLLSQPEAGHSRVTA